MVSERGKLELSFKNFVIGKTGRKYIYYVISGIGGDSLNIQAGD